MNQEFKKLAKQAGFVFWEDESWGPGSEYIDWGSDYDQELDRLCKLIVRECADTIERLTFTVEGPSQEARYQRVLAAQVILEKFGLISPAPIGARYEHEND